MKVTIQPTVHMLWEDDDPSLILTERFGLADASATQRWVRDALAEHWGIRAESCRRIVMSDRNALAWVATDRGPLVVKWSVDPARWSRLGALAELTAWLGGAGSPVSAPIPSTSGSLQVTGSRASIGVQHEVSGDLLDVDDPTQVRAAGAALARLHRDLRGYPAASAVPGMSKPGPLYDQVLSWLDTAGERVPHHAASVLRDLVESRPERDLPVQLVHGDVRSANILMQGTAVAAFLDLEEARMDHPIAELARSAVMLGTRYRQWGPVSPAVREQFREGYLAEGTMGEAEASWWEPLVLWFSLALVPPGSDPTGWGAAAQAVVDSAAGPPTTGSRPGSPRSRSCICSS